jgi:hypothetical protein
MKKEKMNTQETSRYYKEASLQKQFEKNLQAKVDREDLAQWSRGFNSVVNPVDEDAENEASQQGEQDWRDEKNHRQGLVNSLANAQTGR